MGAGCDSDRTSMDTKRTSVNVAVGVCPSVAESACSNLNLSSSLNVSISTSRY